jgi:Glycosyl transferases group 1
LNNHLHIITHDVPYPADFGGVVDIFYKIKALHAIGIKIHLHCFIKNRPAQNELEKYCDKVTYYNRKGFKSFSFSLPYIVSSRKSKLLLENLLKDDYPILFEGIHSTYHLLKNHLHDRKTFLRLFNVEHIYYDHLAKYETNFLRKWYFKNEAMLLKKYEFKIANKTHILTLSIADLNIYKAEFKANNIQFLPAFLPHNFVKINTGKGLYCLYHGNLAINENENAVGWLIDNVFNTLNIPLVIAGLSPSKKLLAHARKNKYVSIVASPSEENLQLLIANAQINILPSFNNTGVKLKLLNALYNGRHCIVNKAGVEGSSLNELCIIGETPTNFIDLIKTIFNKEFTTKEMQHRSTALNKIYNNEENALLIQSLIQ